MDGSALHQLRTWHEDDLVAWLSRLTPEQARAWSAEVDAELYAEAVPPPPPPSQWAPGKAEELRRLLWRRRGPVEPQAPTEPQAATPRAPHRRVARQARRRSPV